MKNMDSKPGNLSPKYLVKVHVVFAIIGGILIAFGANYRETLEFFGSSDDEAIKSIKGQLSDKWKKKELVIVSDFTKFQWDIICVFGGYATHDVGKYSIRNGEGDWAFVFFLEGQPIHLARGSNLDFHIRLPNTHKEHPYLHTRVYFPYDGITYRNCYKNEVGVILEMVPFITGRHVGVVFP